MLLLRELDRQARQQGGAVYMLNGNHESLNVAGDFRWVPDGWAGGGWLHRSPEGPLLVLLHAPAGSCRAAACVAEPPLRVFPPPPALPPAPLPLLPCSYVTAGAFFESARAAGLSEADIAGGDQRRILQARWYLYQPGGAMARELAKNPTVLVVNDIVFAHGGLLPHHLKYGLQVRSCGVVAGGGFLEEEEWQAGAVCCVSPCKLAWLPGSGLAARVGLSPGGSRAGIYSPPPPPAANLTTTFRPTTPSP